MVLTDIWRTWMGCLPGSDGPCAPEVADWLVLLAVAAGLVAVARAGRRVVDVLLTLRATAWSAILARRLSRLVKSRDYDAAAFFDADGAGESWATRRREGLDRLARHLNARYPQTIAWCDGIRGSFSDLRFTDANRVPFPFARFMREHSIWPRWSPPPTGRDCRTSTATGRSTSSGSYGVNVAGFDALQGVDGARSGPGAATLGPVLGPLHPVVAENIARLKAISGLDEVSFHMSGTEAVMAAVRLARFNTRRQADRVFLGRVSRLVGRRAARARQRAALWTTA